MEAYFDNNATTKIDPQVVEAMLPYLLETYGNPNSTHTIGQKAKVAVDEAREIIASYLNCLPVEVLFTSSATESNNWALKGVAEALASKGKHIITTNVEHSSIEKTAKHLEELGYDVTYLPVSETGHISLKQVEDAIRDDTILISIQYANSETGAIMPIRDIGKLCRKKGIIFHSDATQGIKYLDMNVETQKVDLMTFAAHKINGPKAIGCLYIKKKTPIVQLIDGGQQEFNLRAGTENVPYIVGFGKAVAILKDVREERLAYVKHLRDMFEEQLQKNIPDILLNGGEPRMPNLSSIAFLGIPSDTFLARLDMEGIYASAGSACTSGSIQVSGVLKAMRFAYERAVSTIRFSFSHENTEEEIQYAIRTITAIARSIREISSQR